MKTYQMVSIFILLFLTTLHGYGQKKVNIERYESLANAHLYDHEYHEALELFVTLDSVAPNTPEYLYKVGVCYLHSEFKTKGLAFIRKAQELGGVDEKEMNYYLGKSYHLGHSFDKAIESFLAYQSSGATDSTFLANSERFIEQCEVGKKLYADSLEILVTHLGQKVNTIYPEYVPLVSSNDSILIFTSRRENTTGGKKDEQTGQYFEDIYISIKQKNGEWGEPKLIGDNINTDKHDACAGLSPDGTKLIIYKARSARGFIAGDLYLSEKGVDGVWGKPKKLGDNINTKGWEPSACFSPNNKTLYFVSNRKGGEGGTDIYRSELLEDGTWGPAENLGDKVNTYYDEDSPYMHADGRTLFFSSKGHENMGGYDIFSSKFDETKKVWTTPKNLGYPINTADDDIYFVWSADGTRGYYSSYRGDTYGDKDLYMLTRPVKSDHVVCRITLLDSLSEKLLDNATVSILTLPNQEINIRKELNGGLFMEGIPQGKRYKYVVEAEGYLLKEGEFDAPIENSYYEIHKVLKMKGFVDPKPDTNLVATNDSDNNPSSNNGSLATNDSDNNPSSNDNGSLATNDSDSNPSSNDNGSLATNDSDSNPSSNDNGSLAVNDNSTSSSNRENNTDHTTVPSDLETNEIFEEGSKIIYRKILFDHDKAKLRTSSVQELDNFHKLMRAHPTLKVEVSGHTDEIGSRWYNKRLSKKRAKVVVKYLVNKGINKKRFAAVGYGERKPFASNSTAAGRQLNRRTEVKVIKFIDDKKYGDDKINLDDIENWDEDENKGSYSNNTSVPESTSVETYEQSGNMLPLKVHFMFNVYDQLTSYSEGRLDLLVEQLNQNSNMKLRIHAHTDTQGDAQYNQQLSTLRAKTVINYLTSKGIDASRLTIASHGARYPFIEVQNDEGGHLYNRRVEFEVIQK